MTIFGEELVLFRDGAGEPGLIQRRCPHRQVDLAYGRVENDGLRCIYHGWLFAKSGACLDQPGVAHRPGAAVGAPAKSYPCVERGGLFFAYLGGGDVPLFPEYDFLDTQAEERLVIRVLHRCNYLQAIEGNLDQVHVSFLHRMEMQQLKSTDLTEKLDGSSKSAAELLVEDTQPDIKIEETSFGMREIVSRNAPDGVLVKVENYVLPGFAAVPGPTAGQGGYLVNWHVAIDDTSHWKYMIVFRQGKLDAERIRKSIVDGPGGPSYVPEKTGDIWPQDRAAMADGTSYSGLGTAFSFHDLVICEAQGAIYDRTKESLRGEDLAIGLLRRSLLRAIALKQEGKDPPHVARAPGSNRFPELLVMCEVVPVETDLVAHVKDSVESVKAQAAREPAAA